MSKRGSNYTKQQLEALLTALQSFPELVTNVFNNKFPDKAAHNAAWETVASIVSSVGTGEVRTAQNVKNKWSDLKSRTKKRLAESKAYSRRTGGGPPSSLEITPLEEKVIQLIGTTCFEGVTPSSFDTNAPTEARESVITVDVPVVNYMDYNYPEENAEIINNKNTNQAESFSENNNLETLEDAVFDISVRSSSSCVQENITAPSVSKEHPGWFANSKRKAYCSSAERVRKYRKRIESAGRENTEVEREILVRQENMAKDLSQLKTLFEKSVANQEMLIKEIKDSNSILQKIAKSLDSIAYVMKENDI